MTTEGAWDESEAERHERIRQLEALGALTGGVAHDFTNLLTVISGNLELILDSADDAPRLRRHAEAAMQAADDGSVLTEQLVALTRHKPIRPTHVDVHALLQSSRPLLETSVGRACTLALASTCETCVAYVDPAQLRAAILNLTVNARDAMPGGGRVELRTGDAGDGLVAIEVEDDGVGMTPEVLAAATKPFFTTKGEGRGTGLGLSTAYDFAERSGGRLEIASTPGEGTLVRLLLPAGDAEAIQDEPRTLPRTDRGGGGERILLVENDSGVRDLIAGYLHDLGYDVLEAVDGATALSIFDCSETIDLVLVDLRLDGDPQGNELVEELKRHCDPVTVVAMTADGRAKLSDPAVPLVRKPFRLRDLAAVVHEALAARASTGG